MNYLNLVNYCEKLKNRLQYNSKPVNLLSLMDEAIEKLVRKFEEGKMEAIFADDLK